MLTLEQLYLLLKENEILLQVETQKGMEGSFQRLTELMLHRSMVKDLIIDQLQSKVQELEFGSQQKAA